MIDAWLLSMTDGPEATTSSAANGLAALRGYSPCGSSSLRRVHDPELAVADVLVALPVHHRRPRIGRIWVDSGVTQTARSLTRAAGRRAAPSRSRRQASCSKDGSRSGCAASTSAPFPETALSSAGTDLSPARRAAVGLVANGGPPAVAHTGGPFATLARVQPHCCVAWKAQARGPLPARPVRVRER